MSGNRFQSTPSAPPRRDRFIGSRSYFANVDGPEEQLDLLFDGSCLPGYYWLFPTGNGEANVGLGNGRDNRVRLLSKHSFMK